MASGGGSSEPIPSGSGFDPMALAGAMDHSFDPMAMASGSVSAPASAPAVASASNCKITIKFVINVADAMAAIVASTGLQTSMPDAFLSTLQHELSMQDQTGAPSPALTISPFDAPSSATPAK